MKSILVVATLALSCSLVAQTPYGTGTAGTGGVVPNLTCGQAWLGNTAFALSIDSGLGGATAWLGIASAPGSVFVGPTEVLVSLLPGELILLAPLSLSGPVGAPGAGTAVWPAPLTLPLTLAGWRAYAQAVIDEGPGGMLAATRGLEVELVTPPLVFVGVAAGVSSPTYFIDPVAQTLTSQFSTNAQNVTDAEFAHSGRRLYMGLALGNAVREVNLEVSPPSWSTLLNPGASCYGIGVDRDRRLLYSLVGTSVPSRELVAVDIRLGNPAYGQVIATTSGLGLVPGLVERWELSPDGTHAAVLTQIPSRLILVDTDPNSPGYMTFNVVGLVPAVGTSLAMTPAFTADSRQLLITVQSWGPDVASIARYDLVLGTWLDHDPAASGIQNIGPFSSPPAAIPSSPFGIDVARNGRFAAVAGQVSTGYLGRLDLDPSNPLSWNYFPLNPAASISGCWGCAVSGDDTAIAFAAYGPSAPPRVVFVDAATGTSLGTVDIPGATHAYTIKYH